MRIVCPTCQAAYEVPESLIGGARRKVRCARCGGEWAPEAVEPEAPAAAPPPAAAVPAAPPALEAPALNAPALKALAASPPLAPDGAPEPDLPPPPPVVLPPARTASPAIAVPRAAEMLAPPDAPPTTARPPVVMLAMLGWVATLAALGAAGWAAVVFRAPIMQAWAPSKRVYELLGLL